MTPASGSPVVLVVDDDVNVRRVMTLMLQKSGYRTVEASTGREAVDVVAERQDVAAVLLDVMMPVMSGPEALPVMRALVPGLPVVFCSGFDSTAVGEHLGTGVHTTFLAKPFSREELLAAVASAVSAGAHHES